MFPFYTPWKHQKIFGLLVFSGGKNGSIGQEWVNLTSNRIRNRVHNSVAEGAFHLKISKLSCSYAVQFNSSKLASLCQQMCLSRYKDLNASVLNGNFANQEKYFGISIGIYNLNVKNFHFDNSRHALPTKKAVLK